jgi:hypothetical protein
MRAQLHGPSQLPVRTVQVNHTQDRITSQVIVHQGHVALLYIFGQTCQLRCNGAGLVLHCTRTNLQEMI